MTPTERIALAGVIVAAIGVLGTWAIAVLALWGERIKSWFPPKLTIELKGLSSIVIQSPSGMKARYYHLRVRNARPRRFPAAHEAEVLITRVEKPDAAGQPTVVFAETVPLTWVRGEVYPLRRTIGADAEANLLWVREDGWFQFEPIVQPNHFPPAIPRGRADFWVTVQVRSNEADSLPLRLKVAWDGQWHDGDSEITQHLVVAPDPPYSAAHKRATSLSGSGSPGALG